MSHENENSTISTARQHRTTKAGSFNAADFRSIIGSKTGVAEPNKFRVRFFLPNGLNGTTPSQGTGGSEENHTSKSGADKETIRYLEFWAHSTSIPAFGLMAQPAKRYGYGASERRPFAPVYTDVQVMFIADDHGDNWKLFYNWMNMIYNTRAHLGMSTNTGHVNMHGAGNLLAYKPYQLAYRTEYLTDVQIHTFSKTGQQNMHVVLREAFPISMGGVSLNWADNNSFMSLPVTFAYTDLQFFFGSHIPE